MNKPDFEPLGNRYLILPDVIEGESETIGDVTLSVPKDPNRQAIEGTVIACGACAIELEVGAKVFYGQFSGYDQKLEDVEYKVLQFNELLGRRPARTVEAVEELPEVQPPAPIPIETTHGVCFVCNQTASTPTGTLCNDCIPF